MRFLLGTSFPDSLKSAKNGDKCIATPSIQKDNKLFKPNTMNGSCEDKRKANQNVT